MTSGFATFKVVHIPEKKDRTCRMCHKPYGPSYSSYPPDWYNPELCRLCWCDLDGQDLRRLACVWERRVKRRLGKHFRMRAGQLQKWCPDCCQWLSVVQPYWHVAPRGVCRTRRCESCRAKREKELYEKKKITRRAYYRVWKAQYYTPEWLAAERERQRARRKRFRQVAFVAAESSPSSERALSP